MVGLEVSRLGYANAKLGGATWLQQLVKSLVLPCYRHPDYVIDFQISLSCTFVVKFYKGLLYWLLTTRSKRLPVSRTSNFDGIVM